jgi:hypothetical protein
LPAAVGLRDAEADLPDDDKDVILAEPGDTGWDREDDHA